MSISEQEFNQIDGCRQIIADEHARRFAVLDLGNPHGCYGIGWNSELIDPEVVCSADERTIWVGVDQYLAAIDRLTGRIRISVKLQANLFEIMEMEKLIVVRAETEVLVFNPDFSILFDEIFLNVTEEILITGDDLMVRFMEGDVVMVNLNTGKFTQKTGVSAAI